MNNQSSLLLSNPEEVDGDIEADVTKVGRWVTDQEKFLKDLCNKLNVKYSTANRKAREMRQTILRKVDELSVNGVIKKIEELFNERMHVMNSSNQESSMEVISDSIKDEEIRRLTRENKKLLEEINNLKNGIEVYSQEAGDFLLKNDQVFSAEVAASLTRSLRENRAEIFGVQRIIIDHVNKKLIVEYDISGNAIESFEEQGVTKENQERFIKTFSRYMAQLLGQNELLLKFVTEFKDFIHYDENSEEENIKLEREELQRKEESMKYLYEQISHQRTFSEIVGVLDSFYSHEINNWNNGYEELQGVYFRLLNKTKEMTMNYEKMVMDYLVGEDNNQA